MRASLDHELDCMCPQTVWEQETMGRISWANIKKDFVCGAHWPKILWRPTGKKSIEVVALLK